MTDHGPKPETRTAMKIDTAGRIVAGGAAQRSARAGRGDAAGFARALEGDVRPSTGVGAPVATTAITALFALQEVDDAAERRQRARRRAEDMLEALEAIRTGLLLGQLGRSDLMRLSALVESRRETVDDPRLAAVLDEIDLRLNCKTCEVPWDALGYGGFRCLRLLLL